MKIIDKVIKNKPFSDDVKRKDLMDAFGKTFDSYFNHLKYATFDIETTGLSPDHAKVILIGFAIPQNEGQTRLLQFFADNINEEDEILHQANDILGTLDMVITYNGARFDIPFVKKRCKDLGIPFDDTIYNLDAYQLVKYNSDINRLLPNLKQKSVEAFLGFSVDRCDDIDGAESVKQYLQYMLNPSQELLDTILLHNSDDVMQLLNLIKALYPVNLHRAMCIKGFPWGNVYPSIIDKSTRTKINIDKILLSNNKLKIEGSLIGDPLTFQEFCDNEGLCYNFSKDSFSISVNLINHQGIVFLPLNIIFSDNYENIISEAKETGHLAQEYLILSENKKANHAAVTWLSRKIIERTLEAWI